MLLQPLGRMDWQAPQLSSNFLRVDIDPGDGTDALLPKEAHPPPRFLPCSPNNQLSGLLETRIAGEETGTQLIEGGSTIARIGARGAIAPYVFSVEELGRGM